MGGIVGRGAPTSMNRERAIRLVLPSAAFVLAIFLWEAVVRVNHIPPVILPAPSLIAADAGQGLGDLVRLSARDPDDHLRGADRGDRRRRAARAAVRPVAAARIHVLPFAVILQVTPVDLDRAAPAHLLELRVRRFWSAPSSSPSSRFSPTRRSDCRRSTTTSSISFRCIAPRAGGNCYGCAFPPPCPIFSAACGSAAAWR